jgi:class 3 adenylate cyclase/tetratricopeptide (TPR) repeat protein
MSTTATVVFTDLVGSTALRTRLGEEAADDLRRLHDALLTARVEAHGGRIIKGTGDGLVAAFGSASDALTAAVEIQQAIAAHNRRFDAVAALSVRIGLSTGDVAWERGDCFGAPMVEAARLEAAAEGGQILCSEFVRMMARGRGGHEFRPVGLLDLKGLPEPLAASEVLWAAGPDPGALPLPPELAPGESRPFVSRDAQLGLVQRVLADKLRSRLVVVWILGEPGIGKTRLAMEIAGGAHHGGAVVLFGRCTEDLSVPYEPFIQALRWFVAKASAEALPTRLGEAPSELVRLVPDVGDRLQGLEIPGASNSELEQHRLFEAVRSWITAAGGDRSLLAVLDDVHWATRPTVALLGHVARSAEASRVVLVCTARNTAPDENDALAALAEELDRHGVPNYRLELTGLGVEDVGKLVSSAAGRSLDDELRALSNELQKETAGNPLFVDALLSSLPAHPVRSGGGTLPRTIAETVHRRVLRLPPNVADFLRVASVAGLEFDIRVAADTSGGEELEALDTLEQAARAGLVNEAGPNRFRFSHALVRSALRDELSQTRRVRVHLGMGEALERLFADDIDEHVPELAYHFSEAIPVAGAARAFHYAVLAGERATRLLSHDEAAEAYGRALELLDQVKDAEPGTRSRLLLARGEALYRAADFPAARVTLRSAAEEAAATGSAEDLARAAVAHEEAGWRPGTFGAESVELLQRAERALPPLDHPLRALTIASLSRALTFIGRQADARVRGEEALAMAHRLGDARTIAAATKCATFAYLSIRLAPTLVAKSQDLLGMADRLADTELYGFAAYFNLIAHMQLADIDGYDAALPHHLPRIEQVHQSFFKMGTNQVQYARAFLAGDLDLAEALLQGAQEIDRALGSGFEGAHAIGMFLLRREQGRLAGVARILPVMVKLNPQASFWGPGLAALYCELDMVREAKAQFEIIAADGFAAVPRDQSRDFCMGLLSEVCHVLGDRPRAKWLFDELLPLQGRVLVFHGMVGCLGLADRLLGLLAWTAGRPDDARRFLEQALLTSRAIRSPVCVAHCLNDCVRLIPPDDPSLNNSMLDEARALCERHGLAALGRRLAANSV